MFGSWCKPFFWDFFLNNDRCTVVKLGPILFRKSGVRRNSTPSCKSTGELLISSVIYKIVKWRQLEGDKGCSAFEACHSLLFCFRMFLVWLWFLLLLGGGVGFTVRDRNETLFQPPFFFFFFSSSLVTLVFYVCLSCFSCICLLIDLRPTIHALLFSKKLFLI